VLIGRVDLSRFYENKDEYGGRIRVEHESRDHYRVTDTQNGEVLLELRQRGEAAPFEIDVNVKLYTSDGKLVHATPEEFLVGTNTFRRNTFVGNLVGIAINPGPETRG